MGNGQEGASAFLRNYTPLKQQKNYTLLKGASEGDLIRNYRVTFSDSAEIQRSKLFWELRKTMSSEEVVELKAVGERPSQLCSSTSVFEVVTQHLPFSLATYKNLPVHHLSWMMRMAASGFLEIVSKTDFRFKVKPTMIAINKDESAAKVWLDENFSAICPSDQRKITEHAMVQSFLSAFEQAAQNQTLPLALASVTERLKQPFSFAGLCDELERIRTRSTTLRVAEQLRFANKA